MNIIALQDRLPRLPGPAVQGLHSDKTHKCPAPHERRKADII